MGEQNGSEPRQYPPIKYPTIEIPGKGIFVVKFGPGAAFDLQDMGVANIDALPKLLQEWVTRVDPITGDKIIGRADYIQLFKIFAAAIRHQIEISPRDLAYCFQDMEQLYPVAHVLWEAWIKAYPSIEIKLRESAAREPAEGNQVSTPIQ
jgi:hypothetical protein